MHICPNCGGDNPGHAAFCGLCGSSLAPAPPPPPPAETLQWISSFPLATSRFMLYDLGKLLFFTGGIILSLGSLVALAQGAADAPASEWLNVIGIFLMILTALGLLFLLIMVAFFGNRYRVWCCLGPDGVAWEARSRRSRWSNRAAIVAGILAGSPGAAGAGLLAYSQESGLTRWHQVRRVRLHPRLCVVSVMNGWRVVFRLYCTPANYHHAVRLLRMYAPGAVFDGAQP